MKLTSKMARLCDLCNTNEENDEIHRNTPLHRFNYMLDQYQRKKFLRSNRHGVELTIEVRQVNGVTYDFTPEADRKGCYYLNITPDGFQSHGNKVEFNCRIKNKRTRRQDSIVITSAGILHPFEAYSMRDPNNNLDRGIFVEVESGLTYSFIVKLELTEHLVSNFKIPIYVTVQTRSETEAMDSFSVAKTIVVAIHDHIPNVIETVHSGRSPFTNNRWENVPVIKSTKSSAPLLDQFLVPKKYFRILAYSLTRDLGDGVLQEIERMLEPGHVTENNYKDFFHILLWMEEVCSILGLSCYNMENVNLKYVTSSVLQLEVPGLAEKRPSVIKGDSIIIKIHSDHTSYEGTILKVNDQSVDIEGLDPIIISTVKNFPGIEIDVKFVLRRIHFERMHHGVKQVVNNGFVSQLFPDESLLNNQPSEHISLRENQLFNKQIYNNREQMIAVHKIINNTCKGAPYIVFGPPGTGKTVTIVEAIYQLLKLTKKIILVCAPANAACNMLTSKLAKFCSTSDLKRVMSENCDTALVHDDILQFCNLVKDEDGHTSILPFPRENLKKYRIIVTTLVFAGKYSENFRPDVVFIDEAAQAREGEACCGIGLLGADKQLVLAGDPKQLGPVIHSDVCKKYFYDISLLERLMNLDLYKKDVHNNFTTMLRLNFRSHPEVLRLPNRLFYEDQLQAASASAISDPLAKTNLSRMIERNSDQPNQNGAPVEYYSVLALERREGRSPSYYNPKEVLMVYKYVKKLLSLRFSDVTKNVTADHIGIVTPYIRQMYKIREALREFPDIEVGTTETFQGREKRVMIISTVRAQEDLLLQDKKYKLGFVEEPKRFNVAITRAKSKLIVVGNPLVLIRDEKWRELIKQAESLGTKCGAPYPDRTEDFEEITKRFHHLKMKDERPNNQ